MKIHFTDYFTFLVKAPSLSFHYILGVYIFRYTFYYVKIDLPEKIALFTFLGIYLL